VKRARLIFAGEHAEGAFGEGLQFVFAGSGPGAGRELRCGLLVALFVEEGLKDQRGGDLIDQGFVLFAGVAGLVEDVVSLAGGQALVPQMNGQAGEGSELGGKGLSFSSARAFVAGQVQRVADDDAGDRESAGEARDGSENVARSAAGFERHDGLGGEAEFVGDSDADAFGADVEGEIAGGLVHGL
jgi:hypothetical protein